MYSRYNPTEHDTFLPVTGGRSETAGAPPDGAARTFEFPHPGEAAQAADFSAEREQSVSTADGSAQERGGLLDGLRGLFGGLRGGQGLRLNLDLGDIILLLIIALLFLEGGSESDLIILLAVALFVGF